MLKFHSFQVLQHDTRHCETLYLLLLNFCQIHNNSVIKSVTYFNEEFIIGINKTIKYTQLKSEKFYEDGRGRGKILFQI